MTYERIDKCRICGNRSLEKILDLGEQALTGVFPRDRTSKLTTGPLRLVKCQEHEHGDSCGLVQLEHTYDCHEMYGQNYGYRSGLNPHMVRHLQGKVEKILSRIKLTPDDMVIDIGSNDGTSLKAYPEDGATLVGIDPTGVKFRQFYPKHIELISDFFSAPLLRAHHPHRKAKVVTSFSMFYDLDAPMEFMREVHEVLDDEGIWVFEQSYMPKMLSANSYDTVCHEHVEYYALRQIEWMATRVGFRILDVEFNDVNGGSFSVTVAKTSSQLQSQPSVLHAHEKECSFGLATLDPYRAFEGRVTETRRQLRTFIRSACDEGKTVAALGASTKGNVLLQFCGITNSEIGCVAEVNSDKYGCYTPGTWIPIVPEERVLDSKPDYLIVLPWHFRDFFINNRKFHDVNLVMPLPNLEIIPRS